MFSIKPARYRGVNVFLLHAMAYQSPFWLTFKQAEAMGGNVRRGEHACPVVFRKWLDVEEASQPTGKRQVPMLRYYSVFNVAQCDGITAPAVDGAERRHSPIEAAEQIVVAMPQRPAIQQGLDRAFYNPASDSVRMPPPERFDSPENFYSVLFHELTHSTGHESRLNRKGVSGADLLQLRVRWRGVDDERRVKLFQHVTVLLEQQAEKLVHVVAHDKRGRIRTVSGWPADDAGLRR